MMEVELEPDEAPHEALQAVCQGGVTRPTGRAVIRGHLVGRRDEGSRDRLTR